MNNDIIFEEYIKNLTKRGFDLYVEYTAMDNRLWIGIRKDGASFIDYIDNPGDHLTFKIVVWNTIENLVNKVEKLLKQKGEKV